MPKTLLAGGTKSKTPVRLTLALGWICAAGGWSACLGAATTISGQVTGSWQKLHLSAPEIHAFVPDVPNDGRFHVAGRASADTAGNFAVELSQAGPVRLQVVFNEREGFWIGGSDVDQAKVFDVAEGEAVTGVSAAESALICQRIYDGKPLAGPAILRIRDAAGIVVNSVILDDNDPPADTLPGFPAGTYYVLITNQGGVPWAPQWFDQKIHRSEATPVRVARGGELVPVTFHLLRGGSIQGIVHSSDDQPAGRQIVVENVKSDSTGRKLPPAYPGGQARVIGQSFAATGAFYIQGLEDGDYWISATQGLGHPITYYPGTAAGDSATVVTIRNGQDLKDIDWKVRE